MELSERIARWRSAKGLSQHDLAAAVEVSYAAVYQWERGSTVPSVSNLEKIASALGVTMERFFGRVPKARAA